ncbi:hypothetical protein [Streptomyces sp. NPDC001165]
MAVARAALREPDLATVQLDGSGRELRLLVDWLTRGPPPARA